MPAPRSGHDRVRATAQRFVAIAASVLLFASAAFAEGEEPRRAERIISLNPSLSAILLDLGARDRLVGVDSWSRRQREELAGLPDVGGLFDPSLEAVAALEPDLVVLVPSIEQRDFRGRIEALGIRVAEFENTRFDQVLANIRELGALVGSEDAAAQRIAGIEATRRAVEHAAASRERVTCLVVLQRDPVFVVASGTFIDEMLASAGCANPARALGEGYPRASLEWVLAQAPEVLLDTSQDAAGGGLDYWQRWPALPAVRNGRVLHIDPERFTLPGPALGDALRSLASALHGEAIDEEIAQRLATDAADSANSEAARRGALAGGPAR